MRKGKAGPRGQRLERARLTEVTSFDDAGVGTLGMPACIDQPDSQRTLILIRAWQADEITLQGRRSGLPTKHGANRDDDGRQGSPLVGRSDTRNAAATAGANLKKGRTKSAMEEGNSTTDTHTKQAACETSKEQKQAHEQKETDEDWRDEEIERASGEGSEDRGREGPEVTEGRNRSSNTRVAHTVRQEHRIERTEARPEAPR